MDPNKIVDKKGLTFDDVLIVPNYTALKREEINIESYLTTKIKLSIPLISSPMDTVTTSQMAITLGKLGGLGVIHRNLSIANQAKEVAKTKKEIELVAAAVGVGGDLEERAEALINQGLNIMVVDSAHGFSKAVVEATRFLSQKYKQAAIISGNIATTGGAKALIEAGAQGLRVGMGPGSICTTRIVTGIGIPQITAILETVSLAKKYEIPVIADGGLRNSGDIVKAIAAGASTIMSGSLFAGTLETPGKIVIINGKKYKKFRGMGSVLAMKEGSAARYGQKYRRGQERKLVAEGVEGMVEFKGSAEDVVNQLIGGLRSGMYYAGVKNIPELQEKTRLIRISPASAVESHLHDIKFKEQETNNK